MMNRERIENSLKNLGWEISSEELVDGLKEKYQEEAAKAIESAKAATAENTPEIARFAEKNGFTVDKDLIRVTPDTVYKETGPLARTGEQTMSALKRNGPCAYITDDISIIANPTKEEYYFTKNKALAEGIKKAYKLPEAYDLGLPTSSYKSFEFADEKLQSRWEEHVKTERVREYNETRGGRAPSTFEQERNSRLDCQAYLTFFVEKLEEVVAKGEAQKTPGREQPLSEFLANRSDKGQTVPAPVRGHPAPAKEQPVLAPDQRMFNRNSR